MIDVTELFGYIASFFVAISLVMSSFLWLRVLNLIGAIAFVVYGLLLGSIPVVITNGFITVIDIVYLIRIMLPGPHGITYIPVGPEKRGQLDDFVAHYLDDIIRFFPDFSTWRIEECFSSGGKAYLALRDLTLVGFALVYPVPKPEASDEKPIEPVYRYVHEDLFPDRSVIIPVDYVIRKYRGLGLVHHLFETIEENEAARVSFLLAPVRKSARKHRRFLEQIGYERMRSIDSYDLYAKSIGTS